MIHITCMYEIWVMFLCKTTDESFRHIFLFILTGVLFFNVSLSKNKYFCKPQEWFDCTKWIFWFQVSSTFGCLRSEIKTKRNFFLWRAPRWCWTVEPNSTAQRKLKIRYLTLNLSVFYQFFTCVFRFLQFLEIFDLANWHSKKICTDDSPW